MMSSHLVFGHALLANAPLWLTGFLLIFCTISILHPGRLLAEGRSYNVAFSSEIGDVALSFIILIGASVLQREGDAIGGVWTSGWAMVAHALLVAASILVGVVYTVKTRSPYSQLMEEYHGFIIVPVFLYSLAITVPVILGSGTALEKGGAFGLAFLWCACFCFDALTGRLQQQKFILTKEKPLK